MDGLTSVVAFDPRFRTEALPICFPASAMLPLLYWLALSVEEELYADAMRRFELDLL